MQRSEATQKILAAKQQKGLTFEAIAKAVGRHKVWVTSALLGQSTMSAEEAQKATAALKAIIHEMFGDGIMRAIDFEMDIQRKEDPKGDRVVVTINGKFLPYKKW